jgi:hypothetical protein
MEEEAESSMVRKHL